MGIMLNEQQNIAVTKGDGIVAVVAGAGSGKTRVLTARVAHLLERGVDAYNIIAITFTNKAANEMKERIIASNASGRYVWISTFHSMCASILRKNIEYLGYSKDFTIYDTSDSTQVVKRILDRLGIDKKKGKEYYGIISTYKTTGNSDFLYDKDNESIYRMYQEELKLSNAVDFNDLLILTVELFQQFKDILSIYQNRFEYVLVDEFQDTNDLQFKLVCLLAGLHRNLFVVGDEDQSIYGWRGANMHNFKELVKKYINVNVYKLEQNYRSTKTILDSANKLISHNANRVEKNLWSDLGVGDNLEYITLNDDRHEANYAIITIARLVRVNNYNYSDFGILVRANSLTRLLEETLVLHGIPYKVYGAYKFYERKEIKDVMAYLRAICNPSDNEAVRRIINYPKRGIGDGSIAKLLIYSENKGITITTALSEIETNEEFPSVLLNKFIGFKELFFDLIQKNSSLSLSEMIEYLYDKINFDKAYDKEKADDASRIENIDELKNSILMYAKDNYEATLALYLESVALINDSDNANEDNYVSIATIHSAKGLEFPVVIIVGLEEDIFPSSACMQMKSAIEEERRVMYVAITRAMKQLFLTNTRSRFRFGNYTFPRPSRFLEEMGIDTVNVLPSKSATTRSRNLNIPNPNIIYNKPKESVHNKDISDFTIGGTVEHRRYGNGEIISMNGTKAKISFGGLGVKEFDLEIAPIKSIND